VPGSHPFAEDHATGIAVAVVSRERGTVRPFHWSHEVVLKKPAQPAR